MRAAVLEHAGTVTIREVPRPEAAGRALVRVGQAGLCGTDIKIANGQIPVAVPRVLGHEMTGWVAQSRRLPVGTPVLVNPAAFCGHCDLCRRDLPQLCRQGALLGRDTDGCFAEFVAVDEDCLHPLPDGLAGAGLLQVLSTCVHAQSGLPEVASAVVVGLGVAGLLHLQLLALRGTASLIGVSRSAAKRELALAMGATVVATPEAPAAAPSWRWSARARRRRWPRRCGWPGRAGRCWRSASPRPRMRCLPMSGTAKS